MLLLLLSIGLLSLIHAGYSAYEFNQFLKHASATTYPLPKDIIMETLISLLLLTVYAFSQIKPVEELSLVDPERIVQSKFKLQEIQMKDSLTLDEIRGGNIYSLVENRNSFMDIEAKKKEFKQWQDSQVVDKSWGSKHLIL